MTTNEEETADGDAYCVEEAQQAAAQEVSTDEPAIDEPAIDDADLDSVAPMQTAPASEVEAQYGFPSGALTEDRPTVRVKDEVIETIEVRGPLTLPGDLSIDDLVQTMPERPSAKDLPELAYHKDDSQLGDAITINVLDEVGPGGAHHVYGIAFVAGKPDSDDGRRDVCTTLIQFQRGGVHEAGVNGISNEALLAIVRHRLEGFQAGPFACVANQRALTQVCEALRTLKTRTTHRIARGVEGKQIP